MKEIKSKKNLHMTLQDRIEIQECLSKDMTFKAIGRHMAKILRQYLKKQSLL